MVLAERGDGRGRGEHLEGRRRDHPTVALPVDDLTVGQLAHRDGDIRTQPRVAHEPGHGAAYRAGIGVGRFGGGRDRDRVLGRLQGEAPGRRHGGGLVDG